MSYYSVFPLVLMHSCFTKCLPIEESYFIENSRMSIHFSVKMEKIDTFSMALILLRLKLSRKDGNLQYYI